MFNFESFYIEDHEYDTIQRTIINVDENAGIYQSAKDKESDSWHKLWLYCLIAVYPLLTLLIYLILKLSKSESLRKYIPPPKLKR